MAATTPRWRIIGHPAAVRLLDRAVVRSSPAHAYLFSGPNRVGKRTLAVTCAAALNCTAAEVDRPCLVCAACRTTLRHEHPDLMMVEPEEERRLSVEQVRAMRSTIELRPYQGRFKIHIVRDVDDMTEQAANALLKTLEEPPPHAVIILTATGVDAVPATVVSRCQSVALQPVSAAVIAEGLGALYAAPDDQARRLASLAGGRPGWSVAALKAPELAAARESAITRAAELSDGKLGSRLITAADACKAENFLAARAQCLATLDDLAAWWRDLLLVVCGADGDVLHAACIDELRRQAERRGRERIVRGLHEIGATADAVARNVTPRLALEALLLRLG